MLWFMRNKVVNKINEALNITLQPWQIDYVFKNKPLTPPTKTANKSMTVALKQMLDKKAKYVWTLKYPVGVDVREQCKAENYSFIYQGYTQPNIRVKNYLMQWRRVYRKLDTAGLKLAQVLWIK